MKMFILKYAYSENDVREMSTLERVCVKVFNTREEAEAFILNKLAKEWAEKNAKAVEKYGGLPEKFYLEIEEMEDFLMKMEFSGVYSFTFDIEEVTLSETEESENTVADKIVLITENAVIDTEELKNSFRNFPDEIYWGEYAGSFAEYLYRGEEMGQIVILEKNGYIVSNKVYSPAEYTKEFGIEENIKDDISLAEFDEIVADGHNLWNHALSEYSEIVENDCEVVLVKFQTDGYRFVEVKIGGNE